MLNPNKFCDAIATVNRMTEEINSKMAQFKSHRQLLQIENPSAVPLQDAIIEEALFDCDMPTIKKILQDSLDQTIPEQFRLALLDLDRACKSAQAEVGTLSNLKLQ